MSLLHGYDPGRGGAGYRKMRRQMAFEWHLICGVVVGMVEREGLLREWAKHDDRQGQLARLELKRREALES